MSEELKQRQKSLEQLLEQEAHISKKDRLKDIAYNIRKNAKKFIPLGVALGAAGLTGWSISELVQHHKLLSHYNEAYGTIVTTLDTLSAIAKDGTQAQFPQEMIDVPAQLTQLIEQGSHYIYAEAATQVLNEIAENQELLSKGAEINPALSYLESLKKSIGTLARDTKYSLLVIGAIFGSCVSAVLGNMGVNRIVSYTDWQGKLQDKKNLQKLLRKNMPDIRKDMDANPNADKIYDFIDVFRDSQDINGEGLLKIIKELSKYKDEKYTPIFDVISLNPDKYLSYDLIENVFDGYSSMLKCEESEANNPKQLRYSELYLSLESSGFNAKWVVWVINNLREINENKEFFFDALMNSKDKEESVSQIIYFYKSFAKINPGKRLAIADYLLKDGNRQLSSQLQECKIDNEQVLKYLENLDEVPGVGIKGQVKALVKLNNAIRYLNNLGQEDSIEDRLAGLLNYKTYVDGSTIAITQFLARHPDIPQEEVLKNLNEYFFLTQGGEYKSKWIKKELGNIGENKKDLEGLLGNKGERKFVEELTRKTELARYHAFNKTIDQLYHNKLGDILGEKIELGDNADFSDDLINIISCYYTTDYRSELMPLLRDVLKVYLTNPDESEQRISGLEGNKSLEQKIDNNILSAWREGHSASYEIGLRGNVTKSAEGELTGAYNELMRIVKELGYDSEKDSQAVVEKRDIVKEAEISYKEVLKYDLPEEKKHLLAEAKDLLSTLKQKNGIINHQATAITFYDSKDPVESMQMGVVTNSCTNIAITGTNGTNKFAAIVNTIDDNKKVIYMADEAKSKIGRTLAVLTDYGIMTYRKYDNTNLDTDEAWVDYFHTYSKKVGKPLVVIEKIGKYTISDNLKEALLSRGAKRTTVKTVIQKAVCSHWFDDGKGDVGIPEAGYKMEKVAYVLQ